MKRDQAKAIMTRKLKSIRFDESLEEARALMTSNKIRHLPVVDVAGALVGILSDRDLQRAVDSKTERFPAGARVKDFMSWPIKGVADTAPVLEVVQMMLAEKISAVMVLGRDQYARGLITTDDLLRYLASLLAEDSAVRLRTVGSVFDEIGLCTLSA